MEILNFTNMKVLKFYLNIVKGNKEIRKYKNVQTWKHMVG